MFETQEEMERSGDVEDLNDSEEIWAAILELRAFPRPWCLLDPTEMVDYLTLGFSEGLESYTKVILNQTSGADFMHFQENELAELFDEMDSDDIEDTWHTVQGMSLILYCLFKEK